MAIFPQAAGLFRRPKSLRPLRTAGAVLVTLASAGAATADGPVSGWSHSPEFLAQTSWDDQGVVPTSSTPTEREAALAARVDALERYVRGLDVTNTSMQEGLPAGASAAEAACKEVPIKTGPSWRWRGRIFIDGITYDDDDDVSDFFGVDRENEFGFDTARIGVQGDIYENIKYVLEVEFEGTEVDFKDVFAEMHSLPVIGNFRAGHFKEPIGLEELTSSRFDTFMEQSYATATFAPSRNYGGMIYNHLDACQDATWFFGAFRHESDDSPNGIATQRDDRNDWSVSSRFAWLPYYDEPSEGRYLVHLGGSHSYRNAAAAATFETGTYVGNQDPIGVGALAENDDWNQFGLEAALVWGALSFQSEYYHAFVTSGEEYHGAYAQVSYFLTGEYRGYDKAAKAFNRVHPLEPMFWVETCEGCCCGMGAMELTAGYSYVDLEDGDDIAAVDQERAFVDGYVVGLNWYLNPYSRIMFNYNRESTDFVNGGTPDGDANIFGVRWAVDW